VFDLAQTYDSYARLLFSIAYSVLGDRGDAEDCVHDTLLRIWKNPGSYSEARGEFKSFLVVAVRNAAISMLRRRTRHKEIETALPQPPSQEEFEIHDHLERSRLHSALRALPDEQREVLQLGYFEHLTHVQIAQHLHLPLGTVKSRIDLAIRKLASAMPAHESST
jgi:RNA polymerase sigma-70 factor (ECF subfamily)